MISVDIDVSKEKSTICILRPYGEVVASPYEIVHTESAVKALEERVCALEDEVRVVMEATGGYHLPLLAGLKQEGYLSASSIPLS